MMTLFEAESKAVKLLEEVLLASGWRDGWGMTSKEIEGSSQPFFYRNATDLSACMTRVKLSGEAKILYLIYTLTGTDTATSGNRPYKYDVNIRLYFYTDDPAMFDTGYSFENPFAVFTDRLYERLWDNGWSVADGGEEAVASGDDTQEYLHRKVLDISIPI